MIVTTLEFFLNNVTVLKEIFNYYLICDIIDFVAEIQEY